MRPVLNDAELADLLRVEPAVVERLLAETSLPRLSIGGELRFLTGDVLDWLRAQPGPVLMPLEDAGATARSALASEPPPPRAAAEDEAPFVAPDALDGLGPGAADAGFNMARAQLRSALTALADALSPSLTRLSGGRLHPFPDERHRTSPWRIEDAPGPIDALVFPWAMGEAGEPGFADRPRLALELARDAVALALRAPGAVERPDAQALRALRARGAEAVDDQDGGWSIAFRYPFGVRPPTEASLGARLGADLELLAPLWLRVVDA